MKLDNLSYTDVEMLIDALSNQLEFIAKYNSRYPGLYGDSEIKSCKELLDRVTELEECLL